MVAPGKEWEQQGAAGVLGTLGIGTGAPWQSPFPRPLAEAVSGMGTRRGWVFMATWAQS